MKNRQAWLAVTGAAAAFAIYRDPEGSGSAVRDVLNVVADLVHGLFTFAGAVTG